MKKINILWVSMLLFFCYACDMDKLPAGQLPAEEPFTMADCQKTHIGLYSMFQSLTTGSFVTYTDVQMDYFHAILGITGSLNALYSGNITPGMEVLEDIWAADYSVIGSANYFISKIEELQESKTTTYNEDLELDRYKAEAYFTRAFCYFDLAQRYCAAYTVENIGKPHGGLPLVTKYNPTDDNTQYPGRSSMEATFQLINEDLDQALAYFLTFEKDDQEKNKGQLPLEAMSPWINSDVIKAFQARIALYTGDYKLALTNAEELINNRRYTLISDSTQFQALWQLDYGSEAIWWISMTEDYHGSATGSLYLANTGANMSFMPTFGTLNLFEENDIRKAAFLKNQIVTVTGNAKVTVKAFSKYPGNPYLYSGTGINNFVNISKPFRIAEQYLIAAEAAAMIGSNTKANSHLNTLKRSRILGYNSLQLAGSALLSAIKEERRRELIGEGMRMADLKRWGEGFRRSTPQNYNVINQSGNVHIMSYSADDYRFVWPIPQGEIDVNPQIKNQQNPGY